MEIDNKKNCNQKQTPNDEVKLSNFVIKKTLNKLQIVYNNKVINMKKLNLHKPNNNQSGFEIQTQAMKTKF